LDWPSEPKLISAFGNPFVSLLGAFHRPGGHQKTTVACIHAARLPHENPMPLDLASRLKTSIKSWLYLEATATNPFQPPPEAVETTQVRHEVRHRQIASQCRQRRRVATRMAKPSGLPINPFFTLSPIEALTMVEHATAIGATVSPFSRPASTNT